MTTYGTVDAPHVRIALFASTPLSKQGKGGTGGGKGDTGGSGNTGGGGDGDDGGSRGGPLGWYLSLLNRHPLPTKIVTSGVISGLSDIIAQWLTGTSEIEWRRVLALTIVGIVLTAPIFHHLYEYLEVIVPAHRGWHNTATQVLIDQLLAAPIWLALFFPVVALVEQGKPDNVWMERCMGHYRRDFLPSLLLTWKIFVPTQTLSFALLPPAFRVLALNVVDLVYTAALSFVAHAPDET